MLLKLYRYNKHIEPLAGNKGVVVVRKIGVIMTRCFGDGRGALASPPPPTTHLEVKDSTTIGKYTKHSDLHHPTAT